MQPDSILFLKALKYCAIGLAGLMVAGNVTLMYISSDKDEDIAGIVAPALLIVIVSVIAAAVLQWRGEKQLDQRR